MINHAHKWRQLVTWKIAIMNPALLQIWVVLPVVLDGGTARVGSPWFPSARHKAQADQIHRAWSWQNAGCARIGWRRSVTHVYWRPRLLLLMLLVGRVRLWIGWGWGQNGLQRQWNSSLVVLRYNGIIGVGKPEWPSRKPTPVVDEIVLRWCQRQEVWSRIGETALRSHEIRSARGAAHTGRRVRRETRFHLHHGWSWPGGENLGAWVIALHHWNHIWFWLDLHSTSLQQRRLQMRVWSDAHWTAYAAVASSFVTSYRYIAENLNCIHFLQFPEIFFQRSRQFWLGKLRFHVHSRLWLGRTQEFLNEGIGIVLLACIPPVWSRDLRHPPGSARIRAERRVEMLGCHFRQDIDVIKEIIDGRCALPSGGSWRHLAGMNFAVQVRRLDCSDQLPSVSLFLKRHKTPFKQTRNKSWKKSTFRNRILRGIDKVLFRRTILGTEIWCHKRLWWSKGRFCLELNKNDRKINSLDDALTWASLPLTITISAFFSCDGLQTKTIKCGNSWTNIAWSCSNFSVKTYTHLQNITSGVVFSRNIPWLLTCHVMSSNLRYRSTGFCPSHSLFKRFFVHLPHQTFGGFTLWGCPLSSNLMNETGRKNHTEWFWQAGGQVRF